MKRFDEVRLYFFMLGSKTQNLQKMGSSARNMCQVIICLQFLLLEGPHCSSQNVWKPPAVSANAVLMLFKHHFSLQGVWPEWSRQHNFSLILVICEYFSNLCFRMNTDAYKCEFLESALFVWDMLSEIIHFVRMSPRKLT